MPQVTRGIILGCPGPAGSHPVIFFIETVMPSASTDPQVASCANGSLYSNVNGASGSTIFVKVAGSWINLA